MDTAHSNSTVPSTWMKGVALLAMLFGLATVFSGGNVLFGADEARELAGAYVPLVVWFNFLAGFTYVLAAVGIWQGRTWAFGLSAFIAAATAATALVFGILVLLGSAFEMRTVGALALRTGFWVATALALYHWAPRR